MRSAVQLPELLVALQLGVSFFLGNDPALLRLVHTASCQFLCSVALADVCLLHSSSCRLYSFGCTGTAFITHDHELLDFLGALLPHRLLYGNLGCKLCRLLFLLQCLLCLA